MSRSTIASAVAAAALTLALAACGGSPAPSTPAAPAAPAPTSSSTASLSATSPSSSFTSGSTTTQTAAAISIKDFMFTTPASVAPGAMMTITNNDNEAHTLTSKDGGFDVKVAGRGGTAQLAAPTKTGSYRLTCDFHSNMSGTLVVQ